jgi:hypothetical protein
MVEAVRVQVEQGKQPTAVIHGDMGFFKIFVPLLWKDRKLRKKILAMLGVFHYIMV